MVAGTIFITLLPRVHSQLSTSPVNSQPPHNITINEQPCMQFPALTRVLHGLRNFRASHATLYSQLSRGLYSTWSEMARAALLCGGGRSQMAQKASERALSLRVARWQNLIPSFPWIVPGWRDGGAIHGKEGIQFCSVV